LVEHSHNTGHHICVKDTKIIARMDHYGKIKIREAMEIKLNENNLNKDEGLKLIKTWKPILQKLKINNNKPNHYMVTDIFRYGYYY
jgi:hypothetical protein